MTRQFTATCDRCGRSAAATEDSLPEGWFELDYGDDVADLCFSCVTVTEALVRTRSDVSRIIEGPRIGIDGIVLERYRQLNEEGFSPDRDFQLYGDGSLAEAARAYLSEPKDRIPSVHGQPTEWPWKPEWWKPGDGSTYGRIRELEKAGALVAAEIDRLILSLSGHLTPRS